MIATSWLVYHLSGSAFLLACGIRPADPVFRPRPAGRGFSSTGWTGAAYWWPTNWIAAAQAAAMFLVVAFGVAEPWHFIAGNLVLGIVNARSTPRAPVDPARAGRRKKRPAQRHRAQFRDDERRALRRPAHRRRAHRHARRRWSFGLNVASYLVMLEALARMRLPPRRHAPREHG